MNVVIPSPYLEKQSIGSMAPGSVYLDVTNQAFMVSSKRMDGKTTVVKLETGVRLTVLDSSLGTPVGRSLYSGSTSTRTAVSVLRAGQTFQVVGDNNLWMLLYEYDRTKDWLETINLNNGKIAELRNDGEVMLTESRCDVNIREMTRENLKMTDLA